MVDIEHKLKTLIETKAQEMNPEASFCLNEVSTTMWQLNGYVNGKINLSRKRIEYLLDRLIGYYTITLDLPLDSGLKIRRARKFENPTDKQYFQKVSELSYIPKDSSINPALGRLNKLGDSIFYGCIYFNDYFGGIDTVFSEVDALENEFVNVLNSSTKEEVNVHYIGIWDYIRRQQKPYFLSEKVYLYFVAVSEFQEEQFSPEVFTAFQLCDAFFSDILRREGSCRLYNVTSILATFFLEDDNIDGLIYTSVKAEGSPTIALKPVTVDSKLSHKTANCYKIQKSYGYAFFKADLLHKGEVKGDKIHWVGCPNTKHTNYSTPP